MAHRHDPANQAFLFGDNPIDRALSIVPATPASNEFASLAQRLSPQIRLGTSSWSFPGWRGLLYAATAPAHELTRWGLAAYAQCPLLRTVGLDRAFYSLLTTADATSLAALVPPDFRFLVKAHQSVTRPDMHADGSTFGDTAPLERTGRPNPQFLDPAYATDLIVMPAVAGFGSQLGPLVFQFPLLRFAAPSSVGSIEAWIDRVDRFLGGLPVGPLYAVEVRNRELVQGPHASRLIRILRSHRVSWGFAVHPTLPTISRQVENLAAAEWPIEMQPALSLRWLLGHGLGYDEAKRRYEPFTALVDPDAPTRQEVAQAITSAIAAGVPGWVIANNKAEGSAPLTLCRLAEVL